MWVRSIYIKPRIQSIKHIGGACHTYEIHRKNTLLRKGKYIHSKFVEAEHDAVRYTGAS